MKLRSVTITGTPHTDHQSVLFDIAENKPLIAQAVRVYLANQRAGTAKVKTRAEVLLTKKKMYKQKHTGNARHGAQSAPLFVGGGVAHGPHGNANWKLSMSKVMRKKALQSALSVQAAADRVCVISDVEKLSGKTGEFVSMLSTLKLSDKPVLFIVDSLTDAVARATANIGSVFVCQAKDLTTYYVARAHTVLIAKDALNVLSERFGDGSVVAADEKPTKKPSIKVSSKKKMPVTAE